MKEKMQADNEAPVIKAEADEITVSVKATDGDLLAGLSASDNVDGDVTNSLAVVSKSDFVTKGTLKVNYAAFDSHNNVATYTRKVTYEDYRSPRFSADEPFHFVYSTNSSAIFSQVKANDVLDGDITPNIWIIYGEVKEGGTEYPVILQVTNSAGDTSSISITAFREDKASYSLARPALTKYIVYTKAGKSLDMGKYIQGYYKNGIMHLFENEEGKENPEFERENISIDTSEVNFSEPGEYVVRYTLRYIPKNSYEWENLGTTELYLIVEE